jgi:hypothetical protein
MNQRRFLTIENADFSQAAACGRGTAQLKKWAFLPLEAPYGSGRQDHGSHIAVNEPSRVAKSEAMLAVAWAVVPPAVPRPNQQWRSDFEEL